jgi:hypothetical protein
MHSLQCCYNGRENNRVLCKRQRVDKRRDEEESGEGCEEMQRGERREARSECGVTERRAEDIDTVQNHLTRKCCVQPILGSAGAFLSCGTMTCRISSNHLKQWLK